MNCEIALDIVAGAIRPERDAELRAAQEHVAACRDCRAALHAVSVLDDERHADVPPPPAGAADRAIRNALRAGQSERSGRRPFVAGLVAGAAIAASVAGIAIGFGALRTPANGPGSLTPQIGLALNESRPINIALDAETEMPGAEIHVLLNGDIELDGYGGERELRWTVDIAAGANQLSIPVVAIGTGGGQLLVEVEHGDRQRRFLVDIAGAGASGAG